MLVLLAWAVDHSIQQDAFRTGRAPASILSTLGLSPHTVRVGTGAITVNADSYTYFLLLVPSGATRVRVQGHFSATGGSGNDIEVFVLGEDQFTNWKNGHATPTYYNSRKVTVGDVEASLPNGDGRYYVVFNNNFSLLTPKAVQESLSLTYYQ